MKHLILTLVFLSFCAVSAQDSENDSVSAFRNDTLFLASNVNQSGGSLAMEMDKRVLKLMKGKEKESCVVTTTTTTTTVEYKPQSQIDICKAQPKVAGVKIQIAYTKNRDDANRIRAEFKRSFPGVDTELSYRSPDYRILVGNYFNRRSAAQDLRKISKKFPGSLAVNWRVWCRQAR